MTTKARVESYYAGAYWGPRKETAEECARRTATFLDALSRYDSFLAEWFKPAKSLKDARKYRLMPPDLAALAELFSAGVNRADAGGVIERLGFGFWFDNGGPDGDVAELRIHCGGYSDAVPNSCVLTLPRKGQNAERLLTAQALAAIVRAMVSPWEPDWAFATSYDYYQENRKAASDPFSLGWVTYLSNRIGGVPPLPAPVRIEPVEGKGTLIVLTPERFTASNPEHVALAERVRELLDRAGLLKPLQAQP
ncbi:immunity 52 family protein [Myxococcus stipitatus]|uniref:immunity 52 family protein n=1 Tax=Myxococcus stipitatus TaxID=83455 RepID=UPI0030D5CCEB